MNPIDVFYTLDNSHLLKIIWACIFGPAFIAALIFALWNWRSKSWLPTGILALLLIAHIAYSVIATRLYFGDGWYAPNSHSSDAPKF